MVLVEDLWHVTFRHRRLGADCFRRCDYYSETGIFGAGVSVLIVTALDEATTQHNVTTRLMSASGLERGFVLGMYRIVVSDYSAEYEYEYE